MSFFSFFFCFLLLFLFFFFQAEDGIRDIGVTGVQTCALPICSFVSSSEISTKTIRILALNFYRQSIEISRSYSNCFKLVTGCVVCLQIHPRAGDIMNEIFK